MSVFAAHPGIFVLRVRIDKKIPPPDDVKRAALSSAQPIIGWEASEVGCRALTVAAHLPVEGEISAILCSNGQVVEGDEVFPSLGHWTQHVVRRAHAAKVQRAA